MSKEKAVIEALLFAMPEATVDELSKKSGISKSQVNKILNELKEEYKERGIRLINEGEIWKFTIIQDAAEKVKLPPEFPKSLVETLAVIAANRPIKQSDIIKIRGNRAYEHIKKLENLGFIQSERHGNTLIIDLTDKFFEYFSISNEELNKIFPKRI